jgi:hypothetical protein
LATTGDLKLAVDNAAIPRGNVSDEELLRIARCMPDINATLHIERAVALARH